MATALAAFSIITAAAALFSLFMGTVRNSWVCRQRIRLINEDWAAYQRLPSYDAMLWRLWIWDVRRFLAD